eukprot:CAMPEP_0171071538 /NCGR_PEP_ID=MMETSP0766_2-20121228/10379_1 /TAXON_ID=439317 /ORGANISM="Gambierdiscus australes, Strain CAWD 149" /LENGTH=91 /DNA_ID=CAMNT_0011528087 /DNA_START=21 /DNA_END=292 /DNA_ORIENTATION=-
MVGALQLAGLDSLRNDACMKHTCVAEAHLCVSLAHPRPPQRMIRNWAAQVFLLALTAARAVAVSSRPTGNWPGLSLCWPAPAAAAPAAAAP